MVDGRFFDHFFWKVEGSSAHTRESRATHMCHVQLMCGKLLYGGGEPSRVAHVCHMWQLTCMLLLYGGGEPSHVSRVECVAINMHITTIWWRGALRCASHVSRMESVAINMHVTTILWRGALMCGSCVSHVAINVCTLLLYDGREPLTCGSRV